LFHFNLLGDGFKYFLFSSLFGEDEPILNTIFQMAWFNYQLDLSLLQSTILLTSVEFFHKGLMDTFPWELESKNGGFQVV